MDVWIPEGQFTPKKAFAQIIAAGITESPAVTIKESVETEGYFRKSGQDGGGEEKQKAPRGENFGNGRIRFFLGWIGGCRDRFSHEGSCQG